MAEKAHKFKLKKEDNVEIISGKDKGKRGRLLKILHDKNRVVVEGANLVKKAKKRKNQQDRGGIIEIEAAIHYSNVAIVCKKCGPTRIGYKIEAAADPGNAEASGSGSAARASRNTKTRVCRKCGEAL